MGTIEPADWGEVRYKSRDGLSLYAREYGATNKNAVPVICLSGLTRNSKEFHGLASHLCKSHRVLAPDYRGRGQSDYSPDWQTYQLPVELDDVIALLDHLSIPKAFFIGTSQGGLITMLAAAAYKERICGAVLNDIGPVIEQTGLARIAGYVGQIADMRNWPDAVKTLKSTYNGFELDEDEWLEFARIIFAEHNGKPVMDYDASLAKTLPSKKSILETPLPDLWPAFECLKGLPVAVIRGLHSDMLSAATLNAMEQRLPGLVAATISGRGHTPFLTEALALELIERTIARVHY